MTPQDAADDTIRDMLIAARRAAGRWSQKRLADEAGVTERTVKRWEKKGGPEDVPDEDNEAVLLELLPLDPETFSAAVAAARPRGGHVDQAELEAVRDELRALAEEVGRLERRLYDEGVLSE